MRAQPYWHPRSDPAVEATQSTLGSGKGDTLPVLQAAQTIRGALDDSILSAVADRLHVSDAHVYGVASFYSMLSLKPQPARVIRVCDGPVCMLKATTAAARQFAQWASEAGCDVVRSSCLGLCDRAPAAYEGGLPYGPLCADRMAPITYRPCTPLPNYAQPREGECRVAMARIGQVDPESIESAVSVGAYKALASALMKSPTDVLEAVEASGLRGCGGAGFPAGRKWRFVAESSAAEKYVICNGDESEPGTFKDRVLMEGDPHLLLEGMAIAGYAVGASTGIIYIRGEYEWIAQRQERAIAQAETAGWLGGNACGTSFSFHIRVHRGAGAYICGEETALLESLEGKRGEPRIRPPHPAIYGLHGRPTLVNNVETLCQVPAIVQHGPAWFRSRGTAHSPGTKVYTVVGCVRSPGAFEAPFGITLREIIERFGGGLAEGAKFKAALMGGAAGKFVPESMIDIPIDFASGARGVPLGSGAMIILDEQCSIPTVLTWLLSFFEAESCGKCTPCREGTREARLIHARLSSGSAKPNDVMELSRLADMLERTSLCGLGRSVAWPIQSALTHFGDECAQGQNREQCHATPGD